MFQHSVRNKIKSVRKWAVPNFLQAINKMLPDTKWLLALVYPISTTTRDADHIYFIANVLKAILSYKQKNSSYILSIQQYIWIYEKGDAYENFSFSPQLTMSIFSRQKHNFHKSSRTYMYKSLVYWSWHFRRYGKILTEMVHQTWKKFLLNNK